MHPQRLDWSTVQDEPRPHLTTAGTSRDYLFVLTGAQWRGAVANLKSSNKKN